MHRSVTALVLTVGICPVLGCSRFGLPAFIYKVDVQQGNVVSEDMLTRLKSGMDKTKVRFIMG